MKYFLQKFKESTISLLPIFLVVLILNIIFACFSAEIIIKFAVGMIILDVGETLFLIGVDSSIMKMGGYVGARSSKFSKIIVVLFFGFLFGLFATIAEPDVSVLAGQINSAGIDIAKFLLIFVIGAGIGIFVAIALFRIIKDINYKLLMAILFVVVFVVAVFVPNNFIAIAFDAGGATTGIVTSPFLLAFTSSIARNKNDQKDSDNFGVIGVASLGPVLAILFLSLVTASGQSGVVVADSAKLNVLLESLINTSLAIIPLLLIFTLFELAFIKLQRNDKLAILIGSSVTYIGLFLFLLGINFGITNMGTSLGKFLAGQSSYFAIILVAVLGFLITFTEPAVKVLGKQVEDITMGNVKKYVVIIAIAIAMTFAVTLALLKILCGLQMIWIVAIGYGVALVLMPFSSNTFTSLAFDSGGVASGPMSAAFILPLMLGFASCMGSAADGFGLIACIALMPILVLEILGASYQFKLNKRDKFRYRRALELSFGIDVYSNIDKLEDEYNKRQLEKETQMTKREQKANDKMIAKLQSEAGPRKEDDGDDVQG
ncbi:MAG: DUF1538 family protein [Clostridia bacterium]|nr:DUF1538 family protein [Clostridia bacterium]